MGSEEEGTLQGPVADFHLVAQVPSYSLLTFLGPCFQYLGWKDAVQTGVWKALGVLAFCYFHFSICVEKNNECNNSFI